MGEVYRARDTRLNRDVAIKLLPPEFARDPSRLHRFKQEAMAIAALNHPHICQIYDIGPDYLVLEYVDGQPLSGPMPEDVAARLAIQVADALNAAHRKGILHRDLKPSNIMVTRDQRAKIVDFGLAKLLDLDIESTRTAASTIVGTIAYMAPEQVEGRPVDARSEVFSLGAVLYELISGARAFGGATTAHVLNALVRNDPAPIRTDPALERVIMQCLAKDPGRRFQTMADVKAALEGMSHKTVNQQPSIAVLPFANLSSDKENEYFSDGLAEEIINVLAKLPGLTVIARTSAFAFKDKQEDVRRIADALGVANILEGSVRKAGNKLRVTAQLISASSGSHLWSERYDREMVDVFAIQDDIAQAIAAALQIKLLSEPGSRAYTPKLEAYEAYLKGRYQWAKLTPESLAKSREYYEHAIAIDPDFALPHSLLGEDFWALSGNGIEAAEETTPKARAEALRAIAIDPFLPEAHALLGSIAGTCDYDWELASSEFRLAVSVEPVSPHVRLHYGWNLLLTGRLAEAREQYERALRDDPLNALGRLHLGWCLIALGDRRRAFEQYEKAREIDDRSWMPDWSLALAEAIEDKIPRAAAYAERAFALGPWNSMTTALFAGTLVRAGQKARSDELRSQWAASDRAADCVFHLGAGDADAALAALENAITDHDWRILVVLPLIRPVVAPARWITLMRLLNLPETRS